MVTFNHSKLHRELGLAERERDPKLPIKVFIASPDDVGDLRDATLRIIKKEHNDAEITKTGRVKFNPFSWDTHMSVGHVGDSIQETIYKDFGDWCDIFILLFWGKLGSGGTESEYNKFKDTFSAINPNIKFWALVYNEPVHYENVDTCQLNKLREFLSLYQKKWVQIGRTPGAIKTLTEYETEIRSLLNAYYIPE